MSQRTSLVEAARKAKGEADRPVVQRETTLTAQRRAQGDPLCGLPAQLDPLEGWIVTAPWPAPQI
jgi:hypothetical protein